MQLTISPVRNTCGKQLSNGRLNFTYAIAFALIYAFEQRFNLMAGTNIVGSLLYGLLALPVLTSKLLTEVKYTKPIVFLYTITTYSIIASLANPDCALQIKGGVSLILLWLVILSIRTIPLHAMLSSYSASSILLILITMANLLDYIGLPLLLGFQRAGFFNEASHLALYLIPLVAYRLLNNHKDKLAFLSLAAAFLFLPSTTLFVGTLFVVAILYVLKSRRHPIYSVLLALMAINFIVFGLMSGLVPMPDTSARIENLFSGESVETANHLNMSSLVWLNGWSQAFETLRATNGLGLGFNQMGCGPYFNIGDYTPLIQAAFSGDMLNAEDGSLLSAKLIAEFGYVGLCIVCFLALKSFIYLRNLIHFRNLFGTDQFDHYIFKATGAIILLLLLFVRSGPYFLLPLILGLSLISHTPVNKSIKGGLSN